MSQATVYTPPNSLAGYFTSDSFVNLVCGPVGSTKTSASIMKIAYEAARIKPCADGIRRSRCAVVRNTSQMLSDAFIPDFLQWYPEGLAGQFLRTERKFVLKFDDVECEVLFRGLDGADDVRRLLSLQLSFGVMDEFREIHPDIFDAITGRLGRYPNKSMNGGGCVDDSGKDIKKIWGATNPPDMDTWWEEYLSNPPRNASVYFQPSGLSQEADWLQYLPDGYYENLCEGKSDSWVDIYVHARFGASLSGKPVFPNFNANYHVAKETLKPIITEDRPLIIGMDFGLTPACTINQLDMRGRFLTFAELTSENMGIVRFLREKLQPMLLNRFPGHPVVIIGDPAGSQRAQTDERSVFDLIKAAGFTVRPARTNSLAARIASVETLLDTQVDGQPRHLIDPSCKMLIKALRGGYRYKVRKDDEMVSQPEKNKFSHVCFVAGTQVATPSGSIAIEDLVAGDVVATQTGQHVVERAWCSNPAAHVRRYVFSNGAELVATPDHPVYTSNRGFVPIDGLQYTDVLESIEEGPWADQRSTLFRSLKVSGFTGSLRGITKMMQGGTCIGLSGSITTDPSALGCTSTISTVTAPTIGSRIWSVCRQVSIFRGTGMRGRLKIGIDSVRGWMRSGTWLRSGIAQRKGVVGTPNTGSGLPLKDLPKSGIVLTVGRGSPVSKAPPNEVSAQPSANQPHGGQAGWITSSDHVPCAESISQPTSIPRRKRAVRLVGVSSCPEPRKVYAITVSTEHNFYANSILVSNCDGHQYACLHADAGFGSAQQQPRRREIRKVSTMGWT